MSKQYNILIMVTAKDFERVKMHHRKLLEYLPVKKLIYVGSKEVGALLERENWQQEVCFLDEESLIPFADVNAVMQKRLGIADVPRGITGWYYQQFLKMKYADVCEDPFYMTWDGDTVPCRPIVMEDEQNKPLLDCKREYHEEYFTTMSKLIPGLGKCMEYSFISEHMLFSRDIMKELMVEILERAEDGSRSFYERILNVIPREKLTDNSFSEFETYGSFVAMRHPEVYKLRRWYSFRHCGDFFDPTQMSEEDFAWLGRDFHALSFEKGSYVREDNKEIFTKKEYREKLSARQILEIVQEEYLDGYKESWD